MLCRVLILAAICCTAFARCPGCEAIIGDLRVQTLTPTLIRVEPKGPVGFEDRPTFMVVDRSFMGVPILSQSNISDGVSITTDYYTIIVKMSPVSIIVSSPKGKVLYNSLRAPATNLLHWPSPLSAAAYAVEDRPRFIVPEWGPQPVPENAHVDPALHDTNGYDFRNNVAGDMYVFLLGVDLESWFSSRGEFLRLTGPTPQLPDYAYGTWYTEWRQYTEQQAKSEVEQWEKGKFPIDVWALDMNWRNVTQGCGSQTNSSPACEDHFYNHPATQLFPNFTEWFDWLKGKGLHTYFNDHPFPVDLQTSPKEIAFRWQGLTEWISRGLSYWWFDHNWGFTMPPPFTPINETSPYDGLTSQIWGSQVYYETIKKINALNDLAERPIALTRDNGPNWKPGMDNSLGNGFPAHHRFPVWWTGDGVPLYASLETMVDESVHDFRPFVHSDCGGHQNSAKTEADSNAFMRWTAHCAFGTIHRFHQGEHRPWLYPNTTQDVVRKYLQARYALSPSIIAAGQLVQEQGFPPVARCDLVWPEHPEARSNHQYIHLGDTLMAPMDEQETDRSVWIPPGDWQDAWDGSVVTGPKTMNVTKPYSQIPMWHRKGGIMITTASKALRISEQDWGELTLDAFPAEFASMSTRRLIAEDKTTIVSLTTDEAGGVRVQILPPDAAAGRAWHLRVHLAPNQRVAVASLDGAALFSDTMKHIEPSPDCSAVFPFEGRGGAPACKAGPVVELHIPASVAQHNIKLTLERSLTMV